MIAQPNTWDAIRAKGQAKGQPNDTRLTAVSRGTGAPPAALQSAQVETAD